MEHAESHSISVLNSKKEPELGLESTPSSTALNPDDNSHHSSDLDHLADTRESAQKDLRTKLELNENSEEEEAKGKGQAETLDSLPNELRTKLELNENGEDQEKGEGEAENGLKVLDFNLGFGEKPQDRGEGMNYEGGGGDWVVYEDSGWNVNANWNVNERKAAEYDEYEAADEKDNRSNNGKMYQYPVRPEAEDCAFYMRNGTCKFGSNCKFNHPRRKNQDKAGGNEASTERSSQTECKYYLTSGGCKYGNACRYSHSGIRSSAAPTLELNFLGLPIRLGGRDCPYYMRNGSCKYGASCKFNHPDPTAIVGGDTPSGHGNTGSASLQAITQSSAASWSSLMLNETRPFVPVMTLPNQGVSSQIPEWDEYQQPLYVCERTMRPPSPYGMNSPAIGSNVYGYQQQQIPVEEYPERPGELECNYFLKTGDCKFKSNCKFHHPKNRIARAPPCALSDKGLPLRPDQNVCTHYSRYGICKFGPACKFDHPIHPTSVMLAPEQLPSFANSTSSEEAEMPGAGRGHAAIFQQSV